MATPVKVYGPPLSTAVSRVLACLLEKDVQFQLLPVNMAKGEHKSLEYLKIQPFGQVPAFQDESISLFESRAICRYICNKHAEKGNKGLYGLDQLGKASIDQWIEAEGQNFNPASSILVFQLAFAPRMKVPQDEKAIKQNEEKVSKVLDVYEQRLGESRFLAGDEFSLADLSHLPNGHYLVNVADRAELFTSRKNVERWWNEISGRESWKEGNNTHRSLFFLLNYFPFHFFYIYTTKSPLSIPPPPISNYTFLPTNISNLMAISNKLALLLFISSLFVSATFGELVCEELSVDVCAFSIASSGKRCLLETSETKEGKFEYQCRTSEVVVEWMADYIETDKCINACGLDRNSVGIASDALLEPQFTAKLCSPACYQKCPNIVDLYFNMAAGEGVFLPDLCERQRSNPHRAMAELLSSGAAAGGPVSSAEVTAVFPAADAPAPM